MAAVFTFKKSAKETGLRAIGCPHANVDIKRDKKKVGMIYAPTWQTKDGKWSLAFMVNDHTGKNPNCGWGWIFLKPRFETEQEARQYVSDNAEKLLAMDLHFQET